MVIFHSYVSLPEGKFRVQIWERSAESGWMIDKICWYVSDFVQATYDNILDKDFPSEREQKLI